MKVLVVEDSKTINSIIQKRFEQMGLEVHTAFSLKEADELLLKEKFDLLILDLHLPDGEGVDLLCDIRSVTDTKIIVLTSTSDDMLREELFKHGILDYIVKDSNFTYSIEEVLRIVKQINQKEPSKILIIDDSRFILKQISTILRPRNYLVDTAKNGLEGIKLIESNSYDLVILDMELPDLHGLEVLKRIRKNPKFIDLPIVALSGTANAKIVRDILKYGGNDYIKKPFVTEEFILRIDLWIDYYKQQRQLKQKSKELEELNKNLQTMIQQEVQKSRQKEKMLLAQERLAKMGEVVAMIAHQWKQPLNAIRTALSFIDLKLQQQQCTHRECGPVLKKVFEQLEHLSTTIDAFKDFFKPQKHKNRTDFQAIVQKALSLTEMELKKDNINVEVTTKNIQQFDSYENELVQVVVNLIKNAHDALIERNVQNPTIWIEIDGTTLEVKDNAGGISEDIIDKIFEPYFSTKSHNGTGLGLYMSKTIVENHAKGRLLVQNSKEGAVFTITLPKE